MMRIKCELSQPERIDRYLSNQQITGLHSRTRIEKLFEEKMITVNGIIVKKSFQIQNNDIIEFDLPEEEVVSTVEAENIPLDVIYEDEYLAVVNKPAGLVVHPGAGIRNGTLANALVHKYGTQLSSSGENQRPGIVHRLDKDTSGLLLIARDDKTHYLLSQQFQNRQVSKKYLAITTGFPAEPQGEVKTLVNRNPQNRKKMAVTPEGRMAHSLYKVLEYYEYFALMEIDLKTGRTHQIRVHLEHINCPVLGDTLYNNQKRTMNSVPIEYRKRIKFLLTTHLRRQALHAWKLGFVHPVSGLRLDFEVDMPVDMQKAIAYIKQIFVV
ncbi:MAG: RluA family pseudouridine synthase [Candidatus Cloacimonetes bacterium]|nr:RluA family pseudouridine synthase [Candidatus Cloacimonadota bacterium]